VIDLARQRGLDGVCFTEHDAFWPAEELTDLGRRTAFLVLAGVELTTDMGHVLGYGLSPGSGHLALAADAHAAASREGALLFLAHPARDGLLRVDRRTVEYFASVEAINGSDSRLQNVAAAGLAHGFPLPGVGGSDAHTPPECGRAATRFAVPITDQASFLAALRAGRYAPAYVE
jgi:predicted metal-dependent phosphoesterase TrpH